MSESDKTNPRVTRTGGIAIALMVVVWIWGIALGHTDTASWIGKIISLPFGVSIYISAVAVLFTGIGALSGALGWPFFHRKAPDA